MIDEVSDVLGWERKHTIKALNGKVSLGLQSKKRGSKPTYGPIEMEVIIAIWRLSEQPCGVRLKATLPEWLASYQSQPPFSPLRSGPKAASRHSRQKQIPSSDRTPARAGFPGKPNPW